MESGLIKKDRVQDNDANTMYPRGKLAQVLRSIVGNAESEARGVFNVASEGRDSFNEHLGQALALKLNLQTSQ